MYIKESTTGFVHLQTKLHYTTSWGWMDQEQSCQLEGSDGGEAGQGPAM